MKKVIRWLDINFEAFMGMIAFFTMLLIILCQIFGRQIFGAVFPWGEEICRYCYVWVCYLGLAYATRNSIHIEIDAVRRLMPEKVQKVLMIFSQVIMMVLFIYFFKGTLDNVLRNFQSNAQATTFNASVNVMYLAGPIGYGLGIIRSIQTLVWKIRHFNCSMPVFVNPYAVLNGGLDNYCYDDALKAEYREQIPEEAYTEEEAFRAKHSLKRKEG